MRPLNGWIFLEIALEPAYSPSGLLYLPEEAREKTYFATVLAVGEGSSLKAEDVVIVEPGKAKPIHVSESQYDFFNEDERLVMIQEEDILVKIERDGADEDAPEKEEAADVE